MQHACYSKKTATILQNLVLRALPYGPINTFNDFRSTKFDIMELWINQIIAIYKAYCPLNQLSGA